MTTTTTTTTTTKGCRLGIGAAFRDFEIHSRVVLPRASNQEAGPNQDKDVRGHAIKKHSDGIDDEGYDDGVAWVCAKKRLPDLGGAELPDGDG